MAASISKFWDDIFHADKFPFRLATQELLPLGVTHYQIDFIALTITTYTADHRADTWQMPMKADCGPWSENGLKEAIADAAGKKLSYTEFLKRIAASGVTSYFTFLEKKEVLYMGTSGDIFREQMK